MHDRRDRIEESELILARQFADTGGEVGRGEGPCRDDDAVPIIARPRDLAALDRDERMRRERLRDRVGETVAIDRERAAGGHLIGVAGAHDQRAETAHLLMQQPDGVVLGIVGTEGVRAHELGEAIRLVRVCGALGAHLVQHDGDTVLRELPRGLGTGQSTADHVHCL